MRKSSTRSKKPTVLTVPKIELPVVNIVLQEPETVVEQLEIEPVFAPNPGPQTAFLAASEREVLYGGAAGGEPKSWFSRLLSQ